MAENKSINENEAYDDVVTLMSAEGEKIDFTEIAEIVLEDKFYVILQPVELFEGMAEDEAMVFEVTEDEEGKEHLEVVLDETIGQRVFEEFYRLLDEEDESAED